MHKNYKMGLNSDAQNYLRFKQKSGQFGIPAKVYIQNPLAKFKNDDKNFKHSHGQERLLKGDT